MSTDDFVRYSQRIVRDHEIGGGLGMRVAAF